MRIYSERLIGIHFYVYGVTQVTKNNAGFISQSLLERNKIPIKKDQGSHLFI